MEITVKLYTDDRRMGNPPRSTHRGLKEKRGIRAFCVNDLLTAEAEQGSNNEGEKTQTKTKRWSYRYR